MSGIPKQIVRVPFGGVDTRTHPLQLQPPKMAELSNAHLIIGGIEKRLGLKRVAEFADYRYSTSIVQLQQAISDARILFTNNSSLGLVGDTAWYLYDPAGGKWRAKATAFSFPGLPMLAVRTGRLWSAAGQAQFNPLSYDTAYSTDGFYVGAFVDAAGNPRWEAFDATTGAVLGQGYFGGNTSASPRAVSLGSSVLITAIDTSASPKKLFAYLVTRASFGLTFTQVLTNQVNLATDVDATRYCYDIASTGSGRAAFAYYSSTANTIKYAWVDTSMTVSSVLTQATANPAESIAVAVDPIDRGFGIAWMMATSNSVVARLFNEDGSAKTAATTISVSAAISPKFASPQQTCVTGAYGLSTAGVSTFFVFWDNGKTPSYLASIITGGLDVTGSIAAESYLAFGCEITSKAWTYKTNPMVIGKRQGTYDGFVFNRLSGGPVAQVFPGALGQCPDNTVAHPLGGASIGTRMVFTLPWLQSGPGLDGSGLSSEYWKSVDIEHADTSAHRSVQIGNHAYISGGMMRMFDGLSLNEQGILVAPYQNVSAVSGNAGGSLLPSTTYHYRVYYEAFAWTGERFLSQCLGRGSSDALDFSVTTGAADNRATISVPNTNVTARSSEVPFGVAVFRRIQGGSTYYRVSPYDARLSAYPRNTVNTPGLISFVDTMSEANLVLQETDPLSQGVTVPIPAPPHTIVTSGNGRVFISGLDDPDLVMYSKLRATGEPLQFADENRLVIQQGDGPITALATVGDQLIIFRRSQIYLCGGDGLDNTGTSGAFTTPRLVTSDIGCVEPNSIIEYPAGIFFKSTKGYYSLGPDGGMEFIGSDIYAYNAVPVVSTCSIPSLHQVRWLTASVTLVYDYELKAWATWTTTGQDSAIWNGNYMVLPGATGRLLQETAGYYMDDGIPFTMAAEFAWLGVQGLMGRQRLYEILFSGTFLSSHAPVVKIAYDGEPAWAERRTWNPTTVIGEVAASYGGQAFGVGSFGGSANNVPGSYVYQFGVKPQIQRCAMVKVRIEDGPIQGTGPWQGGSCTLTEMALYLGVRPGAVKLGKSKLA